LLDSKITNVESKVNENIETLDKKYNALKEQVSKLTRLYEEERHSKELNSKTKYASDELKNFEIKIKNIFSEERTYMQNYTDNAFKKLEAQITKMEKDNKNETDIIKTSLNSLKDSFEVKVKI
jgi:DNA repair ATPase RecN